jgi:hypothetical protein
MASRVGTLALLVALCGCTFTQKYPAVTVGIAGGVVGFGACYVDDVKASTCGIVGGATAVFLGGITALITLLTDTSAHQLPPDEELQEPAERPIVRARPDAGVPLDTPPATPTDATDAAP